MKILKNEFSLPDLDGMYVYRQKIGITDQRNVSKVTPGLLAIQIQIKAV